MAALQAAPLATYDPAAEVEAMLRIVNAVTAELRAITTPHWRRALESLREGLAEAAGHRSYGVLRRCEREET